MTIHQGKHLVELKDIKDGAITVVNVKKMIVIAIPTYSVKFLDSDGTVLKTQTVERYKSATAPAVSDKTGASFTGWDKPFNNVREDLIVTAQYAVNTYSVNFLDWDGRILKTQTVQHGGNASPPSSPSREGYVFQGWKGDYTNVTGNRTITAAYKIKTFTITFDSNGGSSIAPQIITYGDKAGVPANPIKKNNKFMGWHTAAGVRYDFSQPVKQSMTLYAYWDEEPVITAQDIHIFEDLYTEQDWKRIRLERAKALDKEDGDISAHLTILKDTTNLKKQGTYQLTYEVKDSAGNRAKKSINVIVLDKRAQEDRSRKYIRSISENHIQTLHPNSYWRMTERFQRLTQSLQKTTAQARYTWHLTGQDIAEIRRFNAEHGYSEQENKAFMEKFSYLRR
ncbi:InlB B-repeat-containing protein [[Clostridium] innocuum]|nr:InlB B-repeat-containing protein [[Clostridium] innocuum]MCR0411973.1 InlB B-repeat-containing protein [[Clostridium] innocuum]MCR0534792.1 InlB B-repeat-containing protein [[Clostridium] innocuum]MCR0537594.1 InlB B-repeat-containing protein [[Clostridium] innocuum]MDU1120540.1 InlB B-repeat-containing protein [Erysipelotrichaceae bacterium]